MATPPPRLQLKWTDEMRYTLRLILAITPALDTRTKSSIFNALFLDHIQGPLPAGCGFTADAEWSRLRSQAAKMTPSGDPNGTKYRPVPAHWERVIRAPVTQEERDERAGWKANLDQMMEDLDIGG